MKQKKFILIIGILIFVSIMVLIEINTNANNKVATYEDVLINMQNPRKLKKLNSPISKTNDFLLNTASKITLYDYGDEKLIDECYALIDYYENILSANELKKETSFIYKLNNSNGERVYFSDDALECLIYGYEYSKNSFDTFDITIGKLSSLWNFGGVNNYQSKAPSKEDIEKAVATVDYNNIVIDGNYVSLKNTQTNIDLGGIAKGFIADKVYEYLKTQGVKDAIINLGGNVYVLGYRNSDTLQPFKIGIRTPNANSIEELGYVTITDMSIVSSGAYEQYFIDVDTGDLYGHILNKKTGFPVQTDIAQVSIFSKKSVNGDGLSTIVYSLGAEKGLELIESIDDTECMIVKTDGEIIYSKNIGETSDKKIVFVPK